MLCLSKAIAVLLTILNLHFFSTLATPTFHASRLSSLSTDLSPKTQPLYNTATTLLANHPKRALTKGTFFDGLWAFAITTTTFFVQGPSSVNPASYIEHFAQEVLAKVAIRSASGAPEGPAYRWAFDGVSLSFTSWPHSQTYVPPAVPWAVVSEFVIRMILWRARRGMVVAFSGNIWGPDGQCIQIALNVAEATRSIMDSASDIHGND
ncbi:hypothetical protein BDR22DRAFT_891724 [Usnea florida]